MSTPGDLGATVRLTLAEVEDLTFRALAASGLGPVQNRR